MSDVTSSASEALDNLVNQFSDQLAFFRELIQNAVDAGSAEIDVWFEFEPPEDDGDVGVMIIGVDDYGEGMDRSIIDTKLTRLFSSAKDGDLTKIGKFGIGFVSVFAIKPQAVCVDTSRAGENWRVLFQEDRSFMRIERDEPVEGTKIQIIKSVTEAEFEDFESRAHDTILHWCKHLGAEIRFQGEPINQAFDLQGVAVKVRHEEKGTEIVVGYCDPDACFYGFYNKGLTLHEGTDVSSYGVPGITFKVSSRYLEHTLTRDRIIEDNNYKKAMRIVERMIEGPLVEELFSRYEASLRSRADGDTSLLQLVCTRIRSADKLPKDARGRGVLRSVSGSLLSVDALSKAAKDKKIVLAKVANALTAGLESKGYRVVQEGASVMPILRAVGAPNVTFARSLYGRPLEIQDAPLLERWKPLGEAILRLLQEQGAKLSGVHLGRFDDEDSGIADWPALSQSEPWEVTELKDGRAFGTSLFSRKRALIVNAALPTVQNLIGVAATEPEYAAYTLIKLFYLGHSLEPELDGALAGHVVKARLKRLA